MNQQGKFELMWQDPPAIFRGAPFWSWNGKLEPQRLCRQIASMHAQGMGGFFMHSRYGLKTEYLSEQWFEAVSSCIEKARELGMKPFLYDEDRWPSGSAGGAITREHPEFRSCWLVLSEDPESFNAPACLGVFEIETDEDDCLKSYRPLEEGESTTTSGKGKIVAFLTKNAPSKGWYNDGTYLDTMNPEAVKEFIRSTHEVYASRYGEDFGDLIPAIFTDEPAYGIAFFDSVPDHLQTQWTSGLPSYFLEHRGYDLLQHLPEIFLANPLEFSKVRYDYFHSVSELFTKNFTAQIGQWCQKQNFGLTGHVVMEESLASQIEGTAGAMPHYEHMHWPGVDILTDRAEELATVKQCTSVADQLGKERVLSELYGCTGWDWPLEGHKFIGDWQYVCGVNFRCHHLSHYSLAGGAKRDYPASIIDHSPWWEYYKAVEDYFARLSVTLVQGCPIRDVLVIHPIESAWGLFSPRYVGGYNGRVTCGGQKGLKMMQDALTEIIYKLSGQHYDWDFADESLMDKYAKVSGSTLAVGRMDYKLVIVPPLVTLRSSTVSLLSEFVENGGQVLFVDSVPVFVDGESNESVRELISSSRSCSQKDEEFLPAMESILERRISIAQDGKEQNDIWSMLRQTDDGEIVFLQSHDRKQSQCVQIAVSDCKGPVVLWDNLAGQKRIIPSHVSANKVIFDLKLASSGSALLTLGIEVSDAQQCDTVWETIKSEQVEGPFEVELSEPNTLPLDYCRFKSDNGDLSELMPTLKVDQILRSKCGLDMRLGNEQQPWYLDVTGAVDTKPREMVQMEYSFHITDLPSFCSLVIENPHDYEIFVNGDLARPAKGYWVDEDLKKIDITEQLKVGANLIELKFNYRTNMELEDMYLAGDFAVAKLDGANSCEPDNMTLVAPCKKLKQGSWVGQGLDFYSASVKYKTKIKRPLPGCRTKIKLPGILCTAAAVHVGDETFILPWAPFETDITDALKNEINEVAIEVIGGRKNILGPLHVPWEPMTGPDSFSPENPNWTFGYQLNDHGLMEPIIIETLKETCNTV